METIPKTSELHVIADPSAAAAALDPLRHRILAALAEPGSASTVAATLGLSRQKVNYHMGVLEKAGLIQLLEERQRRGLTERVMTATAGSYLVSPDVLGELAAHPDPVGVDSEKSRLSARYLLAVAGRTIQEVGELAARAAEAGSSAATLTIDTQIRFASADERAAFTEELSRTVNDLVARYHDESADTGRWHRLVVAAHATPPDQRPALAEPVTKNKGVQDHE